MSPNELKRAFDADIAVLPQLKIGITPAKIYYRDLFKGWLLVYASFVGLMFLACFFAANVGAWKHGDDNAIRHHTSDESMQHSHDFFERGHEEDAERDWRMFGGKKPTSTLAEKEAVRTEKMRKREEAFKLELEESRHIRRAKMVLGVLFFPLLPMLFFMGKVNMYVLFKHQLQAQLQTGDYLAKKMRQALKLFFVCFGLLSFVTIPLFDQDLTIFAGILTLIFSGIATSVIVEMEVNRIGTSVLMTAISQYLGKEKHPG